MKLPQSACSNPNFVKIGLGCHLPMFSKNLSYFLLFHFLKTNIYLFTIRNCVWNLPFSKYGISSAQPQRCQQFGPSLPSLCPITLPKSECLMKLDYYFFVQMNRSVYLKTRVPPTVRNLQIDYYLLRSNIYKKQDLYLNYYYCPLSHRLNCTSLANI